MNLAPIIPRRPRWTLEVFNSLYSPADAKGTGDIHQDFDPLRCGWLVLTDRNLVMLDINYKSTMSTKSSGTIKILSKDAWLLGLDLVKKPQAAITYPLFPTIDNQLTSPSRIVVCVDCTGLDSTPTGTVNVSGRTEGRPVSESVQINGHGSYISNVEFDYIIRIEPDLSDSNVTLSVWGKVGTTLGMRECRLLCDTNADGISGVVHGGYLKEASRDITRGYEVTEYNLLGYTEFAQANEYVAGYRAQYRCANFSVSGQLGSCSVASVNFRNGGSSCYIGDWDTHHPDGRQVVSTAHRCTEYVAGTVPLPYDGWTYDDNYAPVTEIGYDAFPHTYLNALMAVCNMLNSLEVGKVVSRPWSLPCVSKTELLGSVLTTATTIAVAGSPTANKLTILSYIVVGKEIMAITGFTGDATGTVIDVVRGQCNTANVYHDMGTEVYIPVAGYSVDGNTSPPLARTNQLCEVNIKSTVMATLESMAENAMTEITNARYYAWFDAFKQIHFTEFNLDTAGYGSTLIITLDDIIEPPSYTLGSIVNKVCGKVVIPDTNNENADQWVYCELTAEASGLTGYDKSVALFGRVTEEIDNQNITAVAPVTGQVDFQTFAKNYLKVNAFPTLTQVIAVDCLIPDEHYWEDIATNDYMKPHLVYTDPMNKHINLLGTKVVAPDFWKPKVDGEWQDSTFVIAEIKTTSQVTGTRPTTTYLTLSRMTTPSEWT